MNLGTMNIFLRILLAISIDFEDKNFARSQGLA